MGRTVGVAAGPVTRTGLEAPVGWGWEGQGIAERGANSCSGLCDREPESFGRKGGRGWGEASRLGPCWAALVEAKERPRSAAEGCETSQKGAEKRVTPGGNPLGVGW